MTGVRALTECELWAPQDQSRPQPLGPRTTARRGAEIARGTPPLACRDATPDHFQADPEEVRRRRFIRIYAYSSSPAVRFQRRRDRSGLRDRARPRRGDHHGLGHLTWRNRSPRSPTSTGWWCGAQPLAYRGPQRVRHAGKLLRGDGAVGKLFQGESRHRPLHRQPRARIPVAFTSASITPTSRTSTSRTASAIRATTRPGARATPRSMKCSSACSSARSGQSALTSNTSIGALPAPSKK